MNVKCNGIPFTLDEALENGYPIDDEFKDGVISELYSKPELFEDDLTEAQQTIESIKEYIEAPHLLDIDDEIDRWNSECIDRLRDKETNNISIDELIEKLTCGVTTLLLDTIKEKLNES